MERSLKTSQLLVTLILSLPFLSSAATEVRSVTHKWRGSLSTTLPLSRAATTALTMMGVDTQADITVPVLLLEAHATHF